MSSQNEYPAYNPRPSFCIGQHDSNRWEALSDNQYYHVIKSGFAFATAPITNRHFRDRVFALRDRVLADRAAGKNASLTAPVLPSLTLDDTLLFPGTYISSMVAYASPWIDLYAADPLVAALSRQVLNLEVAYANFCGVRSVIVPGPRADTDAKRVAQYGRAVLEALEVATRVNLVLHLPMYREPGLEEAESETLSGPDAYSAAGGNGDDHTNEIDLFDSWDTWHTVRSMCEYHPRLLVALRIPRRMPEQPLVTRWFAEPMHYLTFAANVFQQNPSGYPSLSHHHQDMLHKYMRLKSAPWLILADVGPDVNTLAAIVDDGSGSTSQASSSPAPSPTPDASEFPTLTEAVRAGKQVPQKTPQQANKPAQQNAQLQVTNSHFAYLKHVERGQAPYSEMETSTLTSFQDWLQSPLQPLANNLESATYEVFEGDPVKYDQYEKAITAALADWKTLGKPTSALPRPPPGAGAGAGAGASSDAPTTPTGLELVVVVAGAGRGPLVTRVLRASAATGVAVQLWALEKNPNAFVYLQRMNKQIWGGRVHLVHTDMRSWAGPIAEGHEASGTRTTVDVLVSELLGSFGDNELSPECIDGVDGHVARPHGISIPQVYSAHLSPVAYPRVYAELAARAGVGAGSGSATLSEGAAAPAGGAAGALDPNAFETPWVVHLYAVDFVVATHVPGHAQIQQAWEFAHPRRQDKDAATTPGHGGGAMALSTGRNEHNARHTHNTFVCRSRGVVHGLAGFFEAVLYQPAGDAAAPIEISTHPDHINHKSKDMISWFPIFFPLKKPMYIPHDAEIEVSMWRQTDDSKVWYEWSVEVFVWSGPTTRLKVGASELHSSRRVACLM